MMVFPTTTAYEQLAPFFREHIRMNEPLSLHNYFGIGGPADIWIDVEKREDLINLVRLCVEKQWPLLLVGGNSNVIFTKDGIRGIVAQLMIHSYVVSEQGDGTALLEVDAGTQWAPLVRELITQGWAGLEFASSIPGTLGGGLVCNAGAHNQDLSQILEWIDVLDTRSCRVEQGITVLPSILRYRKEHLDLGYRSSRFRKEHESKLAEDGQIIFQTRALIEPTEIVLKLGLRLHHEDPHLLEEHLASYRAIHKQIEPHEHRTDLIFMDPAGEGSATRLIAQAGLQGKTIGQVRISETNANYMVNLGDATTTDVQALIAEVYQKVQKYSQVRLQLNLEIR
jgi:UDP-N-acetylmuramate dehydrogenase